MDTLRDDHVVDAKKDGSRQDENRNAGNDDGKATEGGQDKPPEAVPEDSEPVLCYESFHHAFTVVTTKNKDY